LERNERIFFTKIASEVLGLSTKELQDWANALNLLSPRRTIDLLQDMKTKEMIKKAKIKGHKRWVINEEEFGDFIDVWLTFEKKGKREFIRFTQSELTKSIKGLIKDYEKGIANKKSEVNKNFVFAHINYIVHALSWIARLTLAINAGFFINAKAKTTHAQENITLLGNFLHKLCRNMAEKDTESYGTLIALIYTYFEELNPFEDLYTFPQTQFKN